MIYISNNFCKKLEVWLGCVVKEKKNKSVNIVVVLQFKVDIRNQFYFVNKLFYKMVLLVNCWRKLKRVSGIEISSNNQIDGVLDEYSLNEIELELFIKFI